MEFCPVCMLRKGLAGGAESAQSSSGDTLTPLSDQTAQRFDHYELVRVGLQMLLVSGSSGREYQKLGVLAKAR
jgi:hypothetical protein